MAVDAGALQDVLGVPALALRWVGLGLILFALRLGVLSRANGLARARVWAVIAINLAWASGSVLLLVSGLIQPSSLGCAVILGQAFAVGALSELQYVGLRKSALAAA